MAQAAIRSALDAIMRQFPSLIELYDETAARNPVFKTVYEHFRAYRDTQLQWFRVAESTYDNFVYRMQAAETAAAPRR